MNMAFNRKKSIYNICIVFAILLSSLFGISADINIDYNEDILLNQYLHEAPLVNLNEFVSTGKIRQSTIQAVLEGQTKSYKKNVGLGWSGIFINTCMPTLFFVFLIFLGLCCLIIHSSHSSIIRYIHNMDGQK